MRELEASSSESRAPKTRPNDILTQGLGLEKQGHVKRLGFGATPPIHLDPPLPGPHRSRNNR